MVLPDLPAEGSTSWYNHYQALDASVRAIPESGGVVQLDSFPGGSADVRLTNAMAYAAAQTRIPAIQFPTGVTTLNIGGRTPYNGMKLLGPPGSGGPKNLEIASGGLSTHRINLGVGIGSSALFYGTSNVYGIHVDGLAFQGTHSQQFWHQPSGSIYSATFNDLTFYGLKHVFGTPAAKALLTQVRMSGHWQCLGFQASNSPFTIGGSDNELWVGGFLNLEGTAGDGSWAMTLNGMQKTNVGRIYSTNREGWRGIRVQGSPSTGSGLAFWGPTVEGRNASTPCHGSVVRVEGGGVAFYAPFWAYAMADPTEHGSNDQGVVTVTGGDVLIDRPHYVRATGVSESVPLVYVSGGKVTARAATTSGFSGKPIIDNNGGVVVADDTFSVT